MACLILYLGWDVSELHALIPLALKLVLDLPGKVGLAAETVGDPVAGDLKLGLAVDTLGWTSQPLAVLLLKKFQLNLKNINAILLK